MRGPLNRGHLKIPTRNCAIGRLRRAERPHDRRLGARPRRNNDNDNDNDNDDNDDNNDNNDNDNDNK